MLQLSLENTVCHSLLRAGCRSRSVLGDCQLSDAMKMWLLAFVVGNSKLEIRWDYISSQLNTKGEKELTISWWDENTELFLAKQNVIFFPLVLPWIILG